MAAPTPRKARTHPSGSLITFREEVELLMGQETLELPFEEFKAIYLPKPEILTDDFVQQCVTALQTAEHLSRSPNEESSFVALSPRPSQAASAEIVFDVLVDFCKIITKAGAGSPTTTLVSQSNSTTQSDIEGSSFKIDSFFKLLDTTTSDIHSNSTGDIAVNLEYKLHRVEKDIKDNRKKLVGAAVHVMNNDPRRRHTFSMSIEDEVMRIWCFSRSHTMRSHGINIIKDYKSAIYVLAAFLYASTEELGYDPNIRKYKDDNGDSFFVFRLDTRYFKTLIWIYDYQSSHVATRATHVWKAIEIASFEDLTPLHDAVEVVLKDYWLAELSPSEREVQTAIFKALEEVRMVVDLSGFYKDLASNIRGILDAGSWNQYFLTIEVDARDAVSHPAAKTATLTKTIFDSNVRGHVEPGSDSARSQARGHLPVLADYNSPESRSFAKKTRCQVVYKEVCIAIDRLKDSCLVVETMESCLIGSALMFLANYMHRDISAANLLFFPAAGDGPSGKIGDLEYAKQFGVLRDGATSDPKTGTPLFMSVEIQTGGPIDTVPPSAVPWTAKFKDVANAPIHVYHNFQHDCESYWWLAVWFLYQLKGADTKEFHDIFRPSGGCSDQRRSSYMAEGYLLNEGGGLRALFPDNLRDDIWKVEIARRNLRAYNHERIKDGKTNEMSAYVMPFNEIYVLIVNSLRPISMVSSLPTASDTNTVSTQQRVPLKRKNDDEDDAYVPDSPSDRITGGWSGDRRTTRSSNKRIRGG